MSARSQAFIIQDLTRTDIEQGSCDNPTMIMADFIMLTLSSLLFIYYSVYQYFGFTLGCHAL